MADPALLDAAGRWLIVFYFSVAWLLNFNRASFDDHVRRMIAFRTPYPRFVFCMGMTCSSPAAFCSHSIGTPTSAPGC